MPFQAYLDNIQAKTGKSAEDLKALATEKGYLEPLAKAGVIIDWLARDFDLGRGHAMAIYAYLKGKSE